MQTQEIKDHLDQLIKQLGVADDVRGIADEQITMSNYKRILQSYQVILHNVITLACKLAENLLVIENQAKAEMTKGDPNA